MALQQIVPVSILLRGDGTASTFIFQLGDLYQISSGSAVPYGNLGIVPSSVEVSNPPVPIFSATIDANGNITITLVSSLAAGTIVNLVLNLIFDSGDMGLFPRPVEVQGGMHLEDEFGNDLPSAAGAIFVNATGRNATYRATFRLFVPKPSTSSPLFSIQGSATKLIRVRHIKISWECLIGGPASNSLTLQRFSALTGGVIAATAIPTPLDTNSPIATAAVVQYSTVPSVAPPVGEFLASEIICWTSGSQRAVSTVPVLWEFGVNSAQALVLHGVAEYAGVFCGAVAPVCPFMTIQVEWTEE